MDFLFNKKDNTFSLYIHFPFCLSKCSYCDFFSVECSKKDQIFNDYIAALEKEIIYRINSFGSNFCKSVYLGGGTPSLLSIIKIKELCNFLQSKLIFLSDYEFTIEINPDDVTPEFIQGLNNTLINRISCGLQSFDNKVLKFVNRRADKKINLYAVKVLNKNWNKKLSFDLICGLPFEKRFYFNKYLKKLCKRKIGHISVYSLTVEDNTKLGKLINNEEIDYNFDYADKMWISSKNILKKFGYIQYEISNFALKNQESKHNLTYWNHEDYLGCGSGATGTVYSHNGCAYRFTNSNDISKYIDFWKTVKEVSDIQNNLLEQVQNVEVLDVETSIFEFFMMGLRKAEGVSKNHFYKCFKVPFPKKIEEKFIEWKHQNKADIIFTNNDVFYRLNSKGLLFLNQFLEVLDF